MTVKAKIRVIKKGSAELAETPEKVVKNTKKVSKREIVSTVSEWVSDFRDRRRENAKVAFEKLFQGQPQTSEM